MIAPMEPTPSRSDHSRTKAVIFDLDGTLVQTEALKAQSYAQAVEQLRPGVVKADAVVAAYDGLIGHSRDEVVHALAEQFGVADPARLVALRLRFYDAMLGDTALIKRQEYPQNTALLRRVKAQGYRTALTTVSHASEANLVIDALALRSYFDTIVTMDDVTHAKPDPELYLVAMRRLGVSASECLAVEDSLPGVQAAVAAGLRCLAVANDLTRQSLHAAPPLRGESIVDSPGDVERAASALL